MLIFDSTLFQGDSGGLDQAYRMVEADDDSVVLVGYSTGDWSGGNTGGRDFAAAKVDSDGQVLWMWQASLVRYHSAHQAGLISHCNTRRKYVHLDASLVVAHASLGSRRYEIG